MHTQFKLIALGSALTLTQAAGIELVPEDGTDRLYAGV